MIFTSILRFSLDTPRKYWIVIGPYHLHKSFSGLVLLTFSIISFLFHSLIISLLLALLGLCLIILSIIGNIYTSRRPLFNSITRLDSATSND